MTRDLFFSSELFCYWLVHFMTSTKKVFFLFELTSRNSSIFLWEHVLLRLFVGIWLFEFCLTKPLQSGIQVQLYSSFRRTQQGCSMSIYRLACSCYLLLWSCWLRCLPLLAETYGLWFKVKIPMRLVVPDAKAFRTAKYKVQDFPGCSCNVTGSTFARN